jgi:hypothetical protein
VQPQVLNQPGSFVGVLCFLFAITHQKAGLVKNMAGKIRFSARLGPSVQQV